MWSALALYVPTMSGDSIKDSNDKPFSFTNICTYVPITLDLEELNYDIWRELFQACCVGFGVNTHLKDASPTIPYEEWLKLDSLVKLWIFGSIHKSLVQMVVKLGMTTHDLWKSLENLFRDNKDVRAMQLDHDLRSIEIDDLYVSDYYYKIKVLSYLLSNIDQAVPEKNLVMYMVNGFGDKFDQVASIIRHQNPIPKFLQARSMLLLEETRLVRSRSFCCNAPFLVRI
ncbi:unnamed protein product [Lactuca virosa]|uniref:Uncharacterized protein n=1 Tax=Lactuca virosa TaxID=75947 RepID=A0AAU9N2G5_9ASTR|nr:unnamed protein product [Lactuca virosa]